MCSTVGGRGTVIKPKSPLLSQILPFPQKILPFIIFSARKQLNCLPMKYETYVSYLERQHIKDICTLL